MDMPLSRNSILTISISLTALAVIIVLLSTLLSQLAAYSNEVMILGLALIAVSWVIFFFGGRSGKSQESSSKETVMTVIGCRNCDLREERPFAQGDFVFKELGSCKKCSGNSYIKAIYAIETKKQ
jgi:hypothetical protein